MSKFLGQLYHHIWLTFVEEVCTHMYLKQLRPSCRYITYHNNVFQNVKDENELITITGFPTPLELTKAKCPGNFCIPGMEQIRKKFLEEELKSDGEVINSFQEQ